MKPNSMASTPGATCPMALLPKLLALVCLVPMTSGVELRPRMPLQAKPLLSAEYYAAVAASMKEYSDSEEIEPKFTLLLKFLDRSVVRAHGNSVDAMDESCRERINAAVESFADRRVELHSVFASVGAELEALVERARAKSGREQADLRGITRVEVPGGNVSVMVAVGKALEATQCVEYASLQVQSPPPPCFRRVCVQRVPPTGLCGATPSFQWLQTYRGPDPGMDADWAQQQGADGEGVYYSDVEWGIRQDHEDLPKVLMPRGSAPPSIRENWIEHGTAAVSIAVGMNNSFGVLGIAPKAQAAFFVEQKATARHADREKAILEASLHSREGDIILMEMQTQALSRQTLYVPAEFDPQVFDVVKVATDSGIVVVAAAGNGFHRQGRAYSLDGDLYGLPQWRARNDSGATIVGAGSPDKQHRRLAFSEYGSRVDVQAWGQSVMTAGYGKECGYTGNRTRWYNNRFAGTSSASALVAAAATALQSLAKKEGKALTSQEMRSLLRSTGIPQGGANKNETIGPMIDLRSAITKLRRTRGSVSKAVTSAPLPLV